MHILIWVFDIKKMTLILTIKRQTIPVQSKMNCTEDDLRKIPHFFCSKISTNAFNSIIIEVYYLDVKITNKLIHIQRKKNESVGTYK